MKIRATITKIVAPDGKKPFVVTFPDDPQKLGEHSGSVTFALSAWKGESEPMVGQLVDLEKVQLFSAGWRALSAQPVTPQQQQ